MPNHTRNNFGIQVMVIVQLNVYELKWMSCISAKPCRTEVISSRSAQETPGLFRPNTHKGQAYELFPRSAFSPAKQHFTSTHRDTNIPKHFINLFSLSQIEDECNTVMNVQLSTSFPPSLSLNFIY